MFLTFIKKEFLHIFRDIRTVLIILGMPIAQIILFGFAISTEVKNIQVAILDPAHDVHTNRIIHQIQASEYFNITHITHSPADINRIFKQGSAELIIVFPEHIDQNLVHTGAASIQLIADATDPNRAISLTNYAASIIAASQNETLNAGSPRINIQTQMLYNPQMKSAYNFVPGVMGLILTLICAMMTSIAIVREKETGSLHLLLLSPVRPPLIILAKVTPYLTLSIINIISILLLSVFILGVPITGSMFWLSALSLLFITVSLALGILISTIATTQITAMLISGMLLMMPVMILSGMIFPVENMPRILQWLSHIIPARWFISAVRKLMIEGLSADHVITEISILAAMAIALITASIKKFKLRLQ